jgi:hypothetical protein
MSVTIYTCRLFGGRNLGVNFDSSAGTLTILGQAITISTLPAALQAQWAAAIANAATGAGGVSQGPIPSFGGDNVGQAIGAILDNQSVWASAVRAAFTKYDSTQTQSAQGGIAPSVETWNRT